MAVPERAATDARVPRVLAIDAGGTMTDTFIVDEHGAFVVGKAQTTPEDESLGFIASARDALGQWDSHPERGFPTWVMLKIQQQGLDTAIRPANLLALC